MKVLPFVSHQSHLILGMILAASDAEGKEIFLTTTDDGAKPGMRVL